MKRILYVLLMTLPLTASMFAQRVAPGPGIAPPFGAPSGSPGNPAEAIKAALNLTDGQVEAFKALNQTRQQRAQTILAEINQNRQALDALLNVSALNPTNVGNAAIALRASENKLAAERAWFIAELKKLLTGDQQQTLDTLLAANATIPGLGGPRGFGPGPGARGPRPQ